MTNSRLKGGTLPWFIKWQDTQNKASHKEAEVAHRQNKHTMKRGSGPDTQCIQSVLSVMNNYVK